MKIYDGEITVTNAHKYTIYGGESDQGPQMKIYGGESKMPIDI